MKLLKYAQSFEVVTELPQELRALPKLAENLRWMWHEPTQQLFSSVDPTLWDEVEHNPIEMLARLSKEQCDRLLRDRGFLSLLKSCEEDLDAYLAAGTWFDEKYPGEREKTHIAYFCAEFGLNECLPIYSGGLGILAGDHLKAASDLGLPLVGIGLLYARGYFRQSLSPDGWQQERYPQYDFFRMPLQLLRGDDGKPLSVSIEFPERSVTCHLWKAKVGRIELILLDSNVLENAPQDQNITDTLYGGDEHMRLRQEMILGIGGMRALKKLGITPTVCHMNEGHAAFLTIERLNQLTDDSSVDFKTARQAMVAGNVFTTHTPVPAGFDLFRPEILRQYLSKEIQGLGIAFDEFCRMGRFVPENAEEPVNMAVLAMENANYVNGVSKLHAEVSRGMFEARWPDYPTQEVPIEAITNGVHTSTWMGERMIALLDRYAPPGWRDRPSAPEVWAAVDEIPARELWELRDESRADFVRFCRARLFKQYSRRNAAKNDLVGASGALDPRFLTIGFARRFATYKRASLLLSDRERLISLANHAERPVQFVFAGKSHPRDDGGKKLIQDIFNFIGREDIRNRMVFLEDYDMEVARHLVQGVDVWLNNPRRPLEASGTSGMKVVPNGGLNCSILDGWWAEGYDQGTGWAIGTASHSEDEGYQDWLDSRSLYQVIEQEIAPLFYNRSDGIPMGWIEMMRKSMKELAPMFSTDRMVREYADRFYMPSSRSFLNLTANGFEKAAQGKEWRRFVREHWSEVKINQVLSTAKTSNAMGETFTLSADVSLGGLSSKDVRVQAVVGRANANRELTDVVVHDMEPTTSTKWATTMTCDHVGQMGYVVRVVPYHPDLRVDHELPVIAWQGM